MVGRVLGTWAVPVAASALLASCGGGGGSASPSTPSVPTTLAPSPTPAPSPAVFVCPLPPSTNLSPTCPVLQPRLGTQVNTALDVVLQTRPELFNFADQAGGNPRVLDRDKYHQAVKAELEKQGVCTVIEKEELAIKNTNEFNEQWNIWSSAGYVRRKYVTTCAPSWF